MEEARAVAAAREILEEHGGKMAAGTLFNQLFTVDERFKPVVGKARRFCERHGLAFVDDGGAGTVALAAGDVDEADAVAAMRDLLEEHGGSMSAGPLISRLFTVDERFRPLVGKARRFCERHADVFVFTGGGDGTVSLAQQLPARGAAARGVPGFMFMCSSATEGECLRRLLLGLQRTHLAKMQQIGPTTRLFLLNFQTRVVYGPFRTNRTAALDIVPEAWRGKFPAQLQVVGAGSGGSYESAALPTGQKQRQMGSMTSARADELVALLGGGPSPSPPVGGAQQSQLTTRRGESPAIRVATQFWAFLQSNPSLFSHDRWELTDTYTAWRSDPSNWTEAPVRLSPSKILRALVRKLKVITVKDRNVITYTARARVGLSEASQDAARLASARSAAQRRERLGVPEATPRSTSQTGRLRMDYDAVATRAVPLVNTVEAAGDASDAILAHIFSSGQAVDLVIAVDLEWQSNGSAGDFSLIQIAAAPDQLYVFDVLECPKIISGALRALLEHSSITKVLHDCRQDESKLRDQFGFGLVNVFDTSAADTVLRDVEAHARRGLNAILHEHVSRNNPLKHHVDHTRWCERPLPAEMVSYAAQDVLYLVDAYYEMKCQLERAQLADLASRRTLDNLNDYKKKPSTRTRSQRFANDRMIEDTAQAFWEFMQQGDDQDRNSVKRECATRAGFKQHFEEWKSREQAAGHAWRGGAEAIRLKLIRNQMLEVHAVNVVIQQTGQTKSDSVKAAVQQVHQQRQAIEKDKGGISVATAAPFDSVVRGGQSQSATFTLTNTGNHTRRLTAVSSTAVSGFALAVNGVSAAILPIDIAPQQVVRVELTCSPRGVGVLRTILSLQFGCGRDLGPFTIGRFIEIRSSMDAELVEQLQPTAPYERKKKNRLANRNEQLIPGQGLPKDGLPEWPMRLEFADCPQDWKQILGLREADEWLTESQQTMTIHEYCDHWQRLLWTEERQQATDLQEFAMQNVRLTQNRSFLTLLVPGLAENRPSVLKGDRVKVRIAGEKGRAWEGVAHLVQRDAVDLKFDHRLHASYIAGQAVDVEFVLNRMTMRLFHQGCRLAARLPGQTLFPQPLQTLASRRAAPLRNPNNAMLNRQQLQAVHEIVAGVCRPTPYLLFGPPGTGKTVTLVESILQIYQQQPDSHILACAPTNTAADLLVERLHAVLVGRNDMLRIMAFSRARKGDAAPGPKVLAFTLDDHDGQSFRAPTLQEVLSHRIVVSTLTTASKLHNLGVQRGHFTTICIDEGGQSFESEAIAPVAPLLGETGQLVVAGDPKQLGPIVHSPISADNGLAMSFLERLIARSVYAKDLDAHENTYGYDPRVLTKLVNNYRAHPALLAIPNELFYNNELVAAAEQTLTHSLCDWEHLPKKGVPLIFHGVHGKDEREANSPSWFNISEIEQVMQYVTWLLETRTNRLVAADIGIITPYAKQKQKIRTALDSKTDARVSFRGIKVGSTEEFQGQERRVIILTTVRTSRDFVESDVKHNLGFLVNPKRFNVAITRAQALMIVVGDPRVLHDDANWGELLRYSQRLGAYTGADPPAAALGEGELDYLHSQIERLMQDDEEGEPSDDESDEETAAAPSQRMQQEQLPFDRND